MDFFIQLVVAGLAAGGIYASLALALVMIHEATELINFAQGEMAMFSTYIAWTLINAGFPYWGAFVLTVGISFLGGLALERIIIRPFEGQSFFTLIVVFLALFLIFNSVAGWIWTFTIKSFASPFPDAPLILMEGVSVRMHDVGAIGVTLVVLLLVYGFFRFTALGLAMRAAAQNPDSSRLVGIRVGWMLALGWGLAAAIGAVAGMMVAPIIFLDPSMMFGVLLYGFASALLGGINNPGGAVAGGFIVGVLENLLGAYVPFIGNELKLTVALFIIVASVTFSQILAFSGATNGVLALIVSFGATKMVVLVSMLVVLLLLGAFMDQVSMIMITVPFFIPLAQQVGIDLLWLGVLMLIVMEISFTTPPFGLLIYVMKGVAPPWITLRQIYAAALPFIGLGSEARPAARAC